MVDKDLSQEQIDALIKGGLQEAHDDQNNLSEEVGVKSEGPVIRKAVFEEFSEQVPGKGPVAGMEILMDVPLTVSVELGKAKCYVKDLLNLTVGSIVELDKLAGDHVDILVNGRLFAWGEVVVIDENFGVRVLEIYNTKTRRQDP